MADHVLQLLRDVLRYVTRACNADFSEQETFETRFGKGHS